MTIKTKEEKDAAAFAKLFVLACIRNTFLEELHAGKVPVSLTGDYSDVKVIDGRGQEIPWLELSRFDNAEMKKLMKQVMDRAYTFLLKTDDQAFMDSLRQWGGNASKWDSPEIDVVLSGLTKKQPAESALKKGS